MICRTLSHETRTAPAFPVTVRPSFRNTRSKRPLGCSSWTFSRVKSAGAVPLAPMLLLLSPLARVWPLVEVAAVVQG